VTPGYEPGELPDRSIPRRHTGEFSAAWGRRCRWPLWRPCGWRRTPSPRPKASSSRSNPLGMEEHPGTALSQQGAEFKLSMFCSFKLSRASGALR
jgi:hypothetical protein